jgi:hypothetical protein
MPVARRKSESYVPSGFSLFRHLQAALSTPAVPNCPRWKRVQVRGCQLQRAEGNQHSGIRCYLFATDDACGFLTYDTKLGDVGSAERDIGTLSGDGEVTGTTGKRTFPLKFIGPTVPLRYRITKLSHELYRPHTLPQTVLVRESPSKVSSLSPFTPDDVDVETSR